MALAVGNEQEIKQITGQTQQALLANPQALNYYAYAGNNPITKSDPSGKFAPLLIAVGTLAMYAPQITSYAQSLLTPFGQFAVSQSLEDTKQGNYAWGLFGLITAGDLPGGNIKNLNKLETLPLRQHAIEGFSKLAEITGKESQEILKEASKIGEAFIDYGKNNVGNINIYVQRSEKLITRVTTDPEITRIISAGTNKASQLVKWVENNRLVPLNQSVGLNGLIKNISNFLKK